MEVYEDNSMPENGVSRSAASPYGIHHPTPQQRHGSDGSSSFNNRTTTSTTTTTSNGSTRSMDDLEDDVYGETEDHFTMMQRLRLVDSAEDGALGIPKPKQSIGGRTASTQVRLRRQGFQALSRDKTVNFVVRSIRRGSDDWLSLIKPFVADLAFRSLVKPRQYSEARFRPYACHAAVLFVDLSSYSKITAALAHKGAHALSTVVNAYLGRLLQIIHSFGGDVVKFAGDAVLVVWEGPENDLGINVLAAAKCVLTLQGEAGIHQIEGTSLAFKIHCGLACGLLDSEVFEAPRHAHMQRLYHSVGGEPMEEIGELVDLAAAGEVCVSQDCIEFLGDRAVFRDLRDTLAASDARILVGLTVEDSLLERMEMHVTQTMADRIGRRNSKIEEDFIHPSVLRQLSHGGMSPTQIAQMRSLCILFIAMVANGSSVNWLMEVQGILDRNRCPIVQIIDDDKGVHVVAAVNLYEAIPESAMLGLQVCQDLKEQQVGCAIGMAMGSTFCGVTGSSSISCRWDITGPPAVRAARLMQYAIQHGHEAVIDHSVYKDPMASTHMALLEKAVELKGSPDPCTVYSLSTSKNSSALRILESEYASVHDDTVREIEECLSTGSRARRAVIITGPPLSGKKIVAQRAAGYAGLTPFLHVSSESGGYLQLARTIATWYAYDEDEDIQFGALEILEHLDANRWSRAHDACVELINLAVALGLKACFVVDRSQFLDEFSFSLIRECLRLRVRSRGGRQLVHEWSRRMSDLSEHGSEQSSHTGDSSSSGRICFLCIHVPLYQWQSARDVADRMCAKASYRMSFPLFTLGPVGENDLRMMMRDLADMEVSDRWLEIYAQSSGFCAGYFVERAAASRIISGVLWSQGKKGLAITNEDMELTIPSGMIKINQNMTVHQASAEVAMKFTQTYDELPPLFQTFTKVLTMATRGGYYSLPRKIMWEVLNDLIAEGVDHNVLHTVIEEMVDMFHIREGTNCTGDPDISLMNPALADIAYDVCTPVQIESICMALIERMEPIQDSDFRVPFVMASFYHRIGSNEHVMKHLWKKGYAMFQAKRDMIPESKRYRIMGTSFPFCL